jgi:hypothetical protein
MESDERPRCATVADSAEAAVGALYDQAAVGLIRLAYLMLGDRPSAEDVVQDAFCGLHRNWGQLADQDRALAYVRSSVLNGCRSALRRRAVGQRLTTYQPPAASAEAIALATAEEIPADPPPLRLGSPGLSPRRRPRFWPSLGAGRIRPGWGGRNTWLAPLAAAAVVVAVVLGSLAVTGGGAGRATPATSARPARPASLAGVPPYYVALTIGGGDESEVARAPGRRSGRLLPARCSRPSPCPSRTPASTG